MKRCSLLAFCLLLVGCAHLGGQPGAVLRHDGVYRSARIGDGADAYWYYLRVYPDGTVIDVATSGTPADLRPWFNRRMDDLSIGHVELHGARIEFSQTSKEGTVDYRGTVAGDTLRLTSLSHINGEHDSGVYTFVPWARMPLAPSSAQP